MSSFFGYSGMPGAERIYRPLDLSLFVDSIGSIQISDVDHIAFSSLQDDDRLGVVNRDYSYWYRVLIDSSKFSNAIYIDQANIDSIWVFQKQTSGSWSTVIEGKNYPFNERSFSNSRFIIPFEPNSGSEIFIKIKSNYQTSFNIMVGDLRSVMEYDNNLAILFVLVLGVILAMIGYNTFIYLSVQEWVYLIYVIQSLLTAVLQVVLILCLLAH